MNVKICMDTFEWMYCIVKIGSLAQMGAHFCRDKQLLRVQ